MKRATYKPSHAQCRAFGHQWRPTTVDKVKGTNGAITRYVQNLRCVSCETHKSVNISPRGEIYSRSYQYPEGYQVKGRLSQDEKASMRIGAIGG